MSSSAEDRRRQSLDSAEEGGKSANGRPSTSAAAIFDSQIRLRSALQASRNSSVRDSTSPAKSIDPVTIAWMNGDAKRTEIPSLSESDMRFP